MLTAYPRSNYGTNYAKKLRSSGMVPVTISSSKKRASIHLSILSHEVEKLATSPYFMNTPITLSVEEEGKAKSEQITVVPETADFHPVTEKINYLTLMPAGKGDEVCINVPVQFTNTSSSPGVKKGGKLNVASYSIPITCNAEDIPKSIEINIGLFGMGRVFFAKEAALPKGCKLAKNILIMSIVGRGRKSADADMNAEATA